MTHKLFEAKAVAKLQWFCIVHRWYLILFFFIVALIAGPLQADTVKDGVVAPSAETNQEELEAAVNKLSDSKPMEILRFSVPKVENFPKAGLEMIRRMQDAMMVEYQVKIEPVYIPWFRLNLSVERGETEFTVKTHALGYEKYVPNVVRVDTPIISFDEIKITNRNTKVKSKMVGVIRGSMQEKNYCVEQECMLANSVTHLMTLFNYGRVKSIVALEVLLTPEIKLIEHQNLEFETVFTHYGHIYMFPEHGKYKEGLERQFLQYWRKTETGYIWQKKQ